MTDIQSLLHLIMKLVCIMPFYRGSIPPVQLVVLPIKMLLLFYKSFAGVKVFLPKYPAMRTTPFSSCTAQVKSFVRV